MTDPKPAIDATRFAAEPAITAGTAGTEDPALKRDPPHTNPLALAAEIEPSKEPGAYCADKAHRHVQVSLTEADARLIAAALRLAAASLAWEDAEAQTTDDVALLGVRLDAYRKARGDA